MESQGTNPHLTHDEARAVLALSVHEHWPAYKRYLERMYQLGQRQCETMPSDHRFFQGGTLNMKNMVNIEGKANKILKGK